MQFAQVRLVKHIARSQFFNFHTIKQSSYIMMYDNNIYSGTSDRLKMDIIMSPGL